MPHTASVRGDADVERIWASGGLAPFELPGDVDTHEYVKVNIDTCAEITVLNNPKFFPHGVNPSITYSLETISKDKGPRTSGVGMAYVTTRDGIEL